MRLRVQMQSHVEGEDMPVNKEIADCSTGQGREKGALLYVKNLATALLKKEKQDIMDAHRHPMRSLEQGEKYFNETFKKD